MKIQLFLPDFQKLVKATQVISDTGGTSHSVLFFESGDFITFYKPLDGFIYTAVVDATILHPDKITEMINQFHAYDIPFDIFSNQTTNKTKKVKP